MSGISILKLEGSSDYSSGLQTSSAIHPGVHTILERRLSNTYHRSPANSPSLQNVSDIRLWAIAIPLGKRPSKSLRVPLASVKI